MRIKDVIAHLFDFHVMKKKNWTLEALAAWVQTCEPQEISFAPIVSARPPVTVISRKPRINQRQAEQGWLQVREAFESWRSGQKVSRWRSPGGTA
jgi:hypothetical protein